MELRSVQDFTHASELQVGPLHDPTCIPLVVLGKPVLTGAVKSYVYIYTVFLSIGILVFSKRILFYYSQPSFNASRGRRCRQNMVGKKLHFCGVGEGTMRVLKHESLPQNKHDTTNHILEDQRTECHLWVPHRATCATELKPTLLSMVNSKKFCLNALK